MDIWGSAICTVPTWPEYHKFSRYQIAEKQRPCGICEYESLRVVAVPMTDAYRVFGSPLHQHLLVSAGAFAVTIPNVSLEEVIADLPRYLAEGIL